MSKSDQPAGVAVDRGVRPSVWWREQRGAFEGRQTLAPMYLLGPEKPGSYENGATYEPLYDQAAIDAAVAAERERWLMLCEQALAALVWEAGSEPALYAAQTGAAIAALRSKLGPCVQGRADFRRL